MVDAKTLGTVTEYDLVTKFLYSAKLSKYKVQRQDGNVSECKDSKILSSSACSLRDPYVYTQAEKGGPGDGGPCPMRQMPWRCSPRAEPRSGRLESMEGV